ncbi:MAG: cation transporter [Bacillota bacterium]|nr:cation transporter [Bacillota bacterium]
MKKTIKIEGMSCAHCQARVEKALNSLAGVEAKVDLKKGQATVRLTTAVSDADLTRAVDEAGYTVTAITENKGLFR